MTHHALKPDLCVIGAGSGGLSVAAGAVRMGASVVLVEAAEMGGDCLNHGCVPSKALLASARHAHAMTTGRAFGVAPVTPEIDYAAAKDHVHDVIAEIAPVDSQERFEGLGVHVIRAHARFVGPRAVEAGGRVIEARRFVIATGSRPLVPPIPGLAETPHHTNETIFALRDKPSRLIVIGAGPIGLEMAQAHRRLGCEVTVLEAAKALPKDDPEIAAIALRALRDEGVEIVEGAKVASVSRDGAGVAAEVADGRRWTGSHLLVAVGRRPCTDGLGLEAAGVETTSAGVKVDAGLRTANRRVYAVGDVAGGLQFTHVAGWHAGLVIRSALFRLPVRADASAIPWATYTDPEIAQVGLTEAEARARHGDRLEVLRIPYRESDRAVAERTIDGLVKVMVVKGRPVGASIVGRSAGELISLWSLAISARLKMGAIASFIAPYPTLMELNKRTAGAWFAPRLFESRWVRMAVRLLAKLG